MKPMQDEQERTDAFERLVGVERAQRLLTIWRNSYPCTALNKLYGRAKSKEDVFRANAVREGYKANEIRAFLALQ